MKRKALENLNVSNTMDGVPESAFRPSFVSTSGSHLGSANCSLIAPLPRFHLGGGLAQKRAKWITNGAPAMTADGGAVTSLWT